jgi:hypothetical protein
MAEEPGAIRADGGDPEEGQGLYIGRRGLLDGLAVLLTEEDALRFLLTHPHNAVWHARLTDVTEMSATRPTPPRLIVKPMPYRTGDEQE